MKWFSVLLLIVKNNPKVQQVFHSSPSWKTKKFDRFGYLSFIVKNYNPLWDEQLRELNEKGGKL